MSDVTKEAQDVLLADAKYEYLDCLLLSSTNPKNSLMQRDLMQAAQRYQMLRVRFGRKDV